MAANKVTFEKKDSSRTVGASKEVIIDDEIYAKLNKANQLLVWIAETYTDVELKAVEYTQGVGLSSNSIDALFNAMNK